METGYSFKRAGGPSGFRQRCDKEYTVNAMVRQSERHSHMSFPFLSLKSGRAKQTAAAVNGGIRVLPHSVD